MNGFERLSEVLKALLWEKAKKYKISPIQIQILLFISDHDTNISNVSYLAKEFNLTKATISDAVRVLLNKQLIEKDFSPEDNRRYNLLLTTAGKNLVLDLSQYAQPILNELSAFGELDLTHTYDLLSKLIYKLNHKGIIQVQRTCFNCHFYSGDKNTKHHCNLLEQPLKTHDLRLDCKDFAERIENAIK